jgi:hypothetical protein
MKQATSDCSYQASAVLLSLAFIWFATGGTFLSYASCPPTSRQEKQQPARVEQARRESERLKPSPKYSPTEVIKIQLEALQHNDTPAKDSGIATAFKFASPNNQAATGPLERFILLVKNPAYKPMLDYKSAEFGVLDIKGDDAEQRVTLTNADGEKAVYRFTLSKQHEEPYKDCWMTDGVERVVKQASGQPVA